MVLAGPGLWVRLDHFKIQYHGQPKFHERASRKKLMAAHADPSSQMKTGGECLSDTTNTHKG